MHLSTTRQSRLPSLRLPGARVYDTAERLHQEDHIVAQSIGDGCELNAARPPLLGDRTTVGVEQTLENGEPHIG